GGDKFDRLMDNFGRAHAGQEVAAAEFRSFMERESGQALSRFFDEWLTASGLPESAGPQPAQAFSPMSFYAERDKTLIVYGTRDEEAANRATAEELQRLIRTRWSNETVPVKADKDVSGG